MDKQFRSNKTVGFRTREAFTNVGKTKSAKTRLSSTKATTLDEKSVLQTVNSLNRTLIEVEQSTRLAIEDISDITYSGSSSETIENADELLGDATNAMRAALSYIQKAGQLCSVAKSIMMEIAGSVPEEEPEIIEDLDDEEEE